MHPVLRLQERPCLERPQKFVFCTVPAATVDGCPILCWQRGGQRECPLRNKVARGRCHVPSKGGVGDLSYVGLDVGARDARFRGYNSPAHSRFLNV